MPKIIGEEPRGVRHISQGDTVRDQSVRSRISRGQIAGPRTPGKPICGSLPQRWMYFPDDGCKTLAIQPIAGEFRPQCTSGMAVTPESRHSPCSSNSLTGLVPVLE